MITRMESKRLECVQKEYYEKLYNEGGQITYKTPFYSPEKFYYKNSYYKTLQVYKSIGDDIDDFYDRIQMKNINFKDGISTVNSELLNNLFQRVSLLKSLFRS